MFEVYIEMPSGARSKEHQFQEEIPALDLYKNFVEQMMPWKGFSADVVLLADGKESKREHIEHAA
jgi:hypothetical protein